METGSEPPSPQSPASVHALGIRRLPCFRCGGKAHASWQVCADGNLHRPLCLACDIELNALVLEWMGDPDAAAKIATYRKERAARA